MPDNVKCTFMRAVLAKLRFMQVCEKCIGTVVIRIKCKSAINQEM